MRAPIHAITLAFLFVSANIGLAQEAQEKSTFNLLFKEKGTGRILRRVEISQDEEMIYADREGRAQVQMDANSSFRAYRLGFREKVVSFAELNAAITNTLYLIPDQPSDDEVIIEGQRPKDVSKTEISISEAKAVAPRGDPAQVTKLLPGVQNQAFSTDISIRGSEPNDSGYYVDGIAIPFLYHDIGGLSVLPEKLIASVEFSAGGFGAEYGDARGGIIHLHSKKEIPDEPMTQLKVNIPFYSGVYHERPLSDHESLSVSIRRSYLETFLKGFAEDMTVVPLFYDAHLRYLKRHDSGHTKVLALSSLDGLELLVPAGADENGELTFDIRTYFGAFGVQHVDKLNSNWRYIVNPQVRFNNIQTKVIDNSIIIRGWTYRLPIEWQKRIKGPLKFYLGLDLIHTRANYFINARDAIRDDPFIDFAEAPQIETKSGYIEGSYAAWTAYDWQVEDLTMTPSLRLTYDSSLKKSNADPRFKVRYKFSDQTQLKGAVGLYSKAPLPQETDPIFGSTGLGFEHTMHYIAGIEEKISEYWFFDSQVYYKKSYDVVRSGTDGARYTNDGERRSYGAELFLRRNQTDRAFGWVSYTYSKTEERRSAQDSWGPVEQDQTHVLNLVANYKWSGQWSLGGRLNYHTGDRYTPVDDAVFNANYARYQPRYQANARYGGRLPDYYHIDLYNVYDFLWNEWKLKLRTGIEFLALERPVFQVNYNYDYSKEEYFAGIPPIPYIEVTGEF